MRRGRPRKICSHSFGPAKSGALWGKTSIKVFKGKTAGTLHWLKKEECEDCPAYAPTKIYRT